MNAYSPAGELLRSRRRAARVSRECFYIFLNTLSTSTKQKLR